MKNTVIILGAGSGIGKATALRFAKEGWQVVVAGPSMQDLRQVMDELPGQGHHAVRVDVTRMEDIQALRDDVKKQFSPFHTLVNSVGISRSAAVVDSNFEEWNASLQVMLYGAIHIVRALTDLMMDGGRIIHVTSIHHERVAPGSSGYGMAKAAVTQLVRSLAMELAPRNILSNALAPGFVQTPMSIKSNGVNEMETEWFRDNYIRYDHLPLKRAATPQEIAGAIYFLAGPDASYITGSVLTVDGGLTITF